MLGLLLSCRPPGTRGGLASIVRDMHICPRPDVSHTEGRSEEPFGREPGSPVSVRRPWDRFGQVEWIAGRRL